MGILNLIIPLALIVIVGVWYFFHWWNNKPQEKPGLMFQFLLPKNDDTKTEMINQILSFLHDTRNTFSFEILSDDDGFGMLLWVSLEVYNSEDECRTEIEEFFASSFKDVVVEPVNMEEEVLEGLQEGANIITEEEEEDEVIFGLDEKDKPSSKSANTSSQVTVLELKEGRPFWYSLKAVDKFKDTEPLNNLAAMTRGRIQIIAKPETDWAMKVEQHLISTASGVRSGGLFQDGISYVTQALMPGGNLKQIERDMGKKPAGQKMTPFEKAMVDSGWSSLEWPGFRCEIRIIAPDQKSAQKAERALKLFNLPGANELVRARDNPHITKYIKARSFSKRWVKEKKKNILPADVLGAIWHLAGKEAVAHNIQHSPPKTLPIPAEVPVLKSPWLDKHLAEL